MSGTVDQRNLTSSRESGSELSAPIRLSDHFDFIRCLGRGAMSEVWEARQRSAGGRRVAVKMLHEHRSADAVLVARLHREARILAALQHPHVVRVHDVVRRDDGVPCLVQECLDGESLRARLLREEALLIPAALAVMAPVLHALHAAHAMGVLHRDVKPENVVLTHTADGAVHPFVIDFGIARIEGPGELTLTSRSDSPGTPGYMAPEQIQRARGDVLDARVDVWSAALMLWEILAGRHPFAGGAAAAALTRPCLEDVPRLDVAASWIPPSLGRALAEALHRDRHKRTTSAAALLLSLLDGHPWSSDVWCTSLRVRYGG